MEKNTVRQFTQQEMDWIEEGFQKGLKAKKEKEESEAKYTLERLVDDVWDSINNYHKDNGLLVKGLEVVERKTQHGGKRLRVRFMDSFAEKHSIPNNTSKISLSFD